jgi:tetratricopeptide (TPR) repeat protein
MKIHGSFQRSMGETLKNLFQMNNKDFFELDDFFKFEELPEFCLRMSHAFQQMKTVRQTENKADWRFHEYERSESLGSLFELAMEVGNTEIQLLLVKKIAELHLYLENYLEAAFALEQTLKIIPCDDERCEPFLDFSSTNSRDLCAEMLIRIAKLYIESDYHEYALPICERLVNTCIMPYNHTELMIKVSRFKSKIYREIATKCRSPSHFFRATFTGKQFGELHGKTYIYRKNGRFEGTTNFISEISKLFPAAKVSVDDPDPESPMYIQVGAVVPSSEREINDIFYLPDCQMPKYRTDFITNDRPLVFRGELPKQVAQKSCTNACSRIVMDQFFIRVVKTFPGFARRVMAKSTLLKPLNPIQYWSLLLSRENFALKSASVSGKKLPRTETIERLRKEVGWVLQGKWRLSAPAFLTK